MVAKKTNLNFIIFITLFYPFLLSSVQSISGFVFDFEDKSPINDANIFIKEYDIGTITDENGYFLLPVNSISENQIDLNIKFIGYKQKTIPIDLDRYCLDCKIMDLGSLFIYKSPIESEDLHIHSHRDHLSQISNIDISGKS